MIGRRVVAHDGRVWRVRRRWLPWQPRVRTGAGFSFDGAGAGTDAADALDIFDGPLAIVLGVVLAIVFGVVVAFVFPLLFTVVELVIALVLVPAGIAMRVFLGAPWILTATTAGPPRERRILSVSGWQASREALRDLELDLRLGRTR